MSKRFKQAERATWIGIVANVALTVLKGIAGYVGGSRALIADAAHSASDVVSSIAVLVGIRAAQKPPDREHPYGHGKAESVAALVVAIILMIVGVEIIKDSLTVLFAATVNAPSSIAIIALLLSILTKEILFQYKYRLGKKLNSPALMAEGWHHRSDVFSSLAALLGVGGAMLGGYLGISWMIYLDPLFGIVVSLLVMRVGYQLARVSILVMLEQVVDEEHRQRYIHTASQVSGVQRIDELIARTHGHYVVVDIKLSVKPYLTVEEGHRIAKEVKALLQHTHAEIKQVLIHINPYKP